MKRRAQTRMMPALNKPFRLPALLTIIVATFAVYLPSLQNKFVWDDTALILRDPFIRSWRLILPGFGHFLFTDATASDFYRPIQRLTYTFDYALYGFGHPWGYHLTNILLHAATAVMLFFFVQQLIARMSPAGASKSDVIPWLVALAWAVHPVHSEAVMYIAGRADVLAALFGFGGLYLGLRALEKKSRLRSWLAAFCFLAAILSKESGVTALLVWLAVLLCLREFISLRNWLAIAAAVLAACCALRFTAEHTPPPVLDAPAALSARPALVVRAFDAYAGLLAVPVNLHMERNVPSGSLPIIAGVILLLALAWWIIWTYRRLFPAFIFLIAFLIAYAPTSNIFPLNAHVAEHWLYFSSAFLFAATALSLAATRLPRVVLIAAYACWVVFLGARTWLRNFDWKDQRTFLESTIATGGDTARMMINLGQLESSEGHQDLAIADYKKALDKRPDQPFALLGLAIAYMRARDFDNSQALLDRAKVIPFLRGEALKDEAALEYQKTGQVDLPLLLKAVTLEPDNWDIQYTYIKTLADSGQVNGAVMAAKAVVDKQPWRARSWKVMTKLLVRANRLDLAKHAYEQAQDCDVHLDMTNDQ